MKRISRILGGVKLEPAFSLVFEIRGKLKVEILHWEDKEVGLPLKAEAGRPEDRMLEGDRKKAKLLP
ncbi:hypothetical protein QUB70_32560 [Microcoleus sp. A003_D6]|uniref:hypothetical protein n=1 Tax=Microcoleus sp. A003_D6 TaxID=3055266 RepID=UPI002FD02212